MLRLNRNYSERFLAQGEERRRYYEEHPTNFATFKCMDGRVNLSTLTQTPIGIIRPFRNIGGIFDLGWSVLNAQIAKYVKTSAHVKGRKVLFLVTYHYAKGNPERGCRGHKYDVGEGIRCARRQVEQIRRVFRGHEDVHAILVGVETDHQTLFFHGRDRQRVSMAGLRGEDGEILDVIRTLYPDIHPDIVPDLALLMRGNIRHLNGLKRTEHDIEEREHRERIIAIGDGFEWIPYNCALAINDLELTLDDTIGMAAGIIKDNLLSERIPKGKVLLFASVSYKEDEGETYMRELAVERARYLSRLGLESIRKHHPDLYRHFEALTCVMRWEDRLLEVIKD
ncbi:MAG TPA: hypothetical protein VJ694_03760 [Patescibacteria group bacterium]|nr:hypothetical protein [Patescibacteria group bacterium]